MLRVEVIEKMAEEKQEYPCLKISPATGNVVLFTAPAIGMLMRSGSEDAGGGIGAACGGGWFESCFRPFRGEVKLIQE